LGRNEGIRSGVPLLVRGRVLASGAALRDQLRLFGFGFGAGDLPAVALLRVLREGVLVLVVLRHDHDH